MVTVAQISSELRQLLLLINTTYRALLQTTADHSALKTNKIREKTRTKKIQNKFYKLQQHKTFLGLFPYYVNIASYLVMISKLHDLKIALFHTEIPEFTLKNKSQSTGNPASSLTTIITNLDSIY